MLHHVSTIEHKIKETQQEAVFKQRWHPLSACHDQHVGLVAEQIKAQNDKIEQARLLELHHNEWDTAIEERTASANKQGAQEMGTLDASQPATRPRSTLMNGFERVEEDPMEDNEDSERTKDIIAEKQRKEATKGAESGLRAPRGGQDAHSLLQLEPTAHGRLDLTAGSPEADKEDAIDLNVSRKYERSIASCREQERSVASDVESLVPESQLKISRSEKKQAESSDDSDAESPTGSPRSQA